MRVRNKQWAPTFLAIHNNICLANAHQYQGKWNRAFGNDNVINCEIGCGKGDFIIALAQHFPHQNFVAIEKSAAVLVVLCQKIVALNVPNIKIILGYASSLATIFAVHEIGNIYLNFSDPWPKKKHHHRRLTARALVSLYYHLLQPAGLLHFKTDNDAFFHDSQSSFSDNQWQVVAITNDLHHDEQELLMQQFTSEYEQKFIALNND